jgi:hypothetical protein
MTIESVTVEGSTLSSPHQQAFKRPIRPIPLGELLNHTGFFVRVDTYRPLEHSTVIADLDLSLDVAYWADPDDTRGATLKIGGCSLDLVDGRFRISLPSNLSFPYLEDHGAFELSVFKDLCESFPEVIPPELIRVTEELRREEGNAEN